MSSDPVTTWSAQLNEFGAANGYDETAVNPFVASRVYPFTTEAEALAVAASWRKIAADMRAAYENGILPVAVVDAQARVYRAMDEYNEWVAKFAPFNIDPGVTDYIAPADTVDVWEKTRGLAIALASLAVTDTAWEVFSDSVTHPWTGSGWSAGDAYADLGAKLPDAPIGDWGTTLAVIAAAGLFLLIMVSRD